MKKVLAGIVVAVMVMVCAGASFGAEWPAGTVNVVLPYGAGGDTDTYCRQLFQRVSKITGQTFVVINQQGGSGIVAAMDVMNKKPDGEYKQYSKGWKTLADMLDYAKKNPGKVRYSTVFGSTTEYVGTMLERQAGVEFDNINVGTSGGERMAAMLGGQVDILAANYMQVKDYIEKGDLVCLAVMSKQRVPGIDFPTFTEWAMIVSLRPRSTKSNSPKVLPKKSWTSSQVSARK